MGLATVILVTAGTMATSHAEFKFGLLDVRMEVTGVTKESETSTERYTFTVEVTNPTTRTTYTDYLELVTYQGRHENECSGQYEERLEPGETAALTGCYTIPKGGEPVGIDILGTTDGDAEYLNFLAVLPFTTDFWTDCRSYLYDYEPDICLYSQSISDLVEDVQSEADVAGAPTTDVNSLTTTTTTTTVTGDAPDKPATIYIAADLAHYDWDVNRLTIEFVDEINPFIIDAPRVVVADGTCAISLTSEEYDWDNWDTQAATFTLTEENLKTLASMADPVVHVQEGAFSTFDGTMKLSAFDVPLDSTGKIQGTRIPCAITYGFSEAILGAYAYNYTETIQAVHDGFGAWSDLNPDLVFEYVDDDPLIVVEWSEYHPDHVGLACFDCLVNGASMEVILYSYDCNGARTHYTPNNIRNTVAHELGHIFGLEHHIDETHLMYGAGDVYTQDPFLTLGYAIPEQLPEGIIGEQAIRDGLADLDLMLDGMSTELDEAVAALDRYVDRHSTGETSDTIYFDTQSQADRYNRMIREYNNMYDEYSATVDEYNVLVDELNCMLGIPPEDREQTAAEQDGTT